LAKAPRVNKNECCGCGLCVQSLPSVFRLTPDGVSEVYASDGATKEEIQRVMDDCPVLCVHWVEQ
jgi:ferredoxin